MACKCEKDGPTLASNAIRSTKALNETHQEIKQLVDAIVAAKDVPTRLRAVKSLEALQSQFNTLAIQVKQQSDCAKQCSIATASCLAFDSSANRKVAECLRLEWEAGLLDALQSSKPYGRLHPRYTLSR